MSNCQWRAYGCARAKLPLYQMLSILSREKLQKNKKTFFPKRVDSQRELVYNVDKKRERGKGNVQGSICR